MDHENGPTSIKMSAEEFGQTETTRYWRYGDAHGRRVDDASSYQLIKGASGNSGLGRTRIKHGSTGEASRGRNNT